MPEKLQSELHGPWWEIAWWVNQVVGNDINHSFHLIESGAISVDATVLRAYATRNNPLREGKEPIIVANIIFREDYIELYHIRAIETIEIDIQDQDFLEKIVAWLYEWNIQLDQDKLEEMQCKVEPPSHHGLY